MRGLILSRVRASWEALMHLRTWQLFALALALRLPLVWLRPPSVHTENIKAGFTLAQRGYLGDPFAVPTGPTAHLSPVYPALVAAVRALTPSDDACLHVLAIILALVSSCNIAALLPVSRALRLPAASGSIAALIWVVPLFSWIELSAEHETPFTVAALLALVTLVIRTVGRAPPSVLTGAGIGAATGVAAYFTPTMLPVAALATLVGAWIMRWTLKSLLTVSAVGALACALVILPYTLRNHHALGAWILLRDNFGLELAMSNGPTARATKDENSEVGGTLRDHPFSSFATAEVVRELGEVEYNHRLEREAIGWIRANPAAFLRLVAERAGYMVLPYSARWWQRLLAAAISLMSIAGYVLLRRSRYRLGINCLAGAIVGYLLIYLVIEHDIRYLYPALFLESLIAGSFLAVLLRRSNDHRLSPEGAAAANVRRPPGIAAPRPTGDADG